MNPVEPWLRVPDYSTYTWETWLVYSLAGTVGYVVRLAVTKTPVRMPAVTERGLYLNALGEWITAVAVALLADHNVLFATIAAVGASSIVQVVLQWIPAAVRRALGIPEPRGREKEA